MCNFSPPLPASARMIAPDFEAKPSMPLVSFRVERQEEGDPNLHISCGITLPLSCKTLFNHFHRNFLTRIKARVKLYRLNANPNILLFPLQARCNREKPPCKYYHPPQHLKDQLLINGRNHLALKNALMQQMGMPPNGQQIITNQMQPMVSAISLSSRSHVNKFVTFRPRTLT